MDVSETEVTTYFLQMCDGPKRVTPTPPQGVSLRHEPSIPVSRYRSLYRGVGYPWLWYERDLLADHELRQLIRAPGVEVYSLESEGQDAGFAELKFDGQNVQLLYFGLLPTCIGQGLGTYFLCALIDAAFRDGVGRVWVHTCNLDHPRALEHYRRCGFEEFKRESGTIAIPDLAFERQRHAKERLPPL